MAKEIVLIPHPRSIRQQGKGYSLRSGQFIRLVGPEVSRLTFAGEYLAEAIRREAGVDLALSAGPIGPESEVAVSLRVDPSFEHCQGYRLSITGKGVETIAAGPAGAFYAATTLLQLVRQFGRRLPAVHIEDWPDYPARGVMLDISRDKVPTVETLYALVDLLASWKVNQFQLYTEHTFAYRNHPTVWKNASPLTGQDILKLDRYCRDRFVELVPNQNSFGHMQRWLMHRQYRPMSEAPKGFVTPWGERVPFPCSLCPIDPRSIEFIRSLYEELLPHFSSGMFNVGCDETWDVGQGRSKEESERVGAGRVYLDFLLKIYEAVKSHGRTMQFWGDIVMKHDELVPELPRDLIALEWGYEADHDFDGHGARFARASVPFYVCPGTSSWNAIAGRTDNMIGNCHSAAVNGLKHGAVGYLNTDWGDNGHWQPLPVSYAGFAYGAAAGWSPEAADRVDLARALDVFAFRDRAGIMGKLALEMGDLYTLAGPKLHNQTVFYRILRDPVRELGKLSETRAEDLDRAEESVETLMGRLSGTRMERPDATLVGDEFRNAGRMIRHACRLGKAKLAAKEKGGRPKVAGLIPEIRRIIGEHRRVWLARNGEGGLKESVARLEARLKEYVR